MAGHEGRRDIATVGASAKMGRSSTRVKPSGHTETAANREVCGLGSSISTGLSSASFARPNKIRGENCTIEILTGAVLL